MRIKRYFAPNIREAIRQVREEQGPDAVILSNRQVDGGVELVAAVDYDEDLVNGAAAPATATAAPPGAPPARAAKPRILWSQEPALVQMRQELSSVRGLLEHQLSGLAWGENARRHPLRTRMMQVLLESGFSTALCRQLVARVPENLDLNGARRLVLGMLAHQLSVTGDDIVSQGGVVALLGPTGVGKTTTAAKLAARYALRHGANKVALVTTDNYRIGAHEQIRTYSKILDVPLRVARSREELAATLATLPHKGLVIIDTAGMSQRDLRLSEQLGLIGGTQLKSYLVLAASTQMLALDETVDAFAGAKPAGCILTKVDETTSLGGALSVAIERRLPVAYVSDGQRVPEDLHPARAHTLLSRSVAIAGQTSARRRKAAHAQGADADATSFALAFGRSTTDVHA